MGVASKFYGPNSASQADMTCIVTGQIRLSVSSACGSRKQSVGYDGGVPQGWLKSGFNVPMACSAAFWQ